MRTSKKTVSSTSDEISDELFATLLKHVADFVSASPIRIDKAAHSFALALKAAKQRRLASSDSKSAEIITRALYRWSSDPNYLDDNGQPMPLPLAGTGKSIANLLKLVNGRANATLVRTTKFSDSLRQDKFGRYVPRKSYFDFKHDRDMYRHHVLNTAIHFFETVNSNLVGKESLVERMVYVTDLPMRSEKAFRQFTKSQADVFLRTINRWLESKRRCEEIVRSTSAHRPIKAGVHLFAFSNARIASHRIHART